MGILVGDASFDIELELTSWHVNGTGQGTLLVLIRLANIQDGVVVEVGRYRWAFDLSNLRLRGV